MGLTFLGITLLACAAVAVASNSVAVSHTKGPCVAGIRKVEVQYTTVSGTYWHDAEYISVFKATDFDEFKRAYESGKAKLSSYNDLLDSNDPHSSLEGTLELGLQEGAYVAVLAQVHSGVVQHSSEDLKVEQPFKVACTGDQLIGEIRAPRIVFESPVPFLISLPEGTTEDLTVDVAVISGTSELGTMKVTIEQGHKFARGQVPLEAIETAEVKIQACVEADRCPFKPRKLKLHGSEAGDKVQAIRGAYNITESCQLDIASRLSDVLPLMSELLPQVQEAAADEKLDEEERKRLQNLQIDIAIRTQAVRDAVKQAPQCDGLMAEVYELVSDKAIAEDAVEAQIIEAEEAMESVGRTTDSSMLATSTALSRPDTTHDTRPRLGLTKKSMSLLTTSTSLSRAFGLGLFNGYHKGNFGTKVWKKLGDWWYAFVRYPFRPMHDYFDGEEGCSMHMKNLAKYFFAPYGKAATKDESPGYKEGAHFVVDTFHSLVSYGSVITGLVLLITGTTPALGLKIAASAYAGYRALKYITYTLWGASLAGLTVAKAVGDLFFTFLFGAVDLVAEGVKGVVKGVGKCCKGIGKCCSSCRRSSQVQDIEAGHHREVTKLLPPPPKSEDAPNNLPASGISVPVAKSDLVVDLARNFIVRVLTTMKRSGPFLDRFVKAARYLCEQAETGSGQLSFGGVEIEIEEPLCFADMKHLTESLLEDSQFYVTKNGRPILIDGNDKVEGLKSYLGDEGAVGIVLPGEWNPTDALEQSGSE